MRKLNVTDRQTDGHTDEGGALQYLPSPGLRHPREIIRPGIFVEVHYGISVYGISHVKCLYVFVKVFFFLPTGSFPDDNLRISCWKIQ